MFRIFSISNAPENAIRIPAIDPPAIKPDDNSTPGLVSDSAADLPVAARSTSQRMMPPKKMGNEAAKGRYTPTANGREETWQSSSRMAMKAPMITRIQGSF